MSEQSGELETLKARLETAKNEHSAMETDLNTRIDEMRTPVEAQETLRRAVEIARIQRERQRSLESISTLEAKISEIRSRIPDNNPTPVPAVEQTDGAEAANSTLAGSSTRVEGVPPSGSQAALVPSAGTPNLPTVTGVLPQGPGNSTTPVPRDTPQLDVFNVADGDAQARLARNKRPAAVTPAQDDRLRVHAVQVGNNTYKDTTTVLFGDPGGSLQGTTNLYLCEMARLVKSVEITTRPNEIVMVKGVRAVTAVDSQINLRTAAVRWPESTFDVEDSAIAHMIEFPTNMRISNGQPSVKQFVHRNLYPVGMAIPAGPVFSEFTQATLSYPGQRSYLGPGMVKEIFSTTSPVWSASCCMPSMKVNSTWQQMVAQLLLRVPAATDNEKNAIIRLYSAALREFSESHCSWTAWMYKVLVAALQVKVFCGLFVQTNSLNRMVRVYYEARRARTVANVWESYPGVNLPDAFAVQRMAVYTQWIVPDTFQVTWSRKSFNSLVDYLMGAEVLIVEIANENHLRLIPYIIFGAQPEALPMSVQAAALKDITASMDNSGDLWNPAAQEWFGITSSDRTGQICGRLHFMIAQGLDLTAEFGLSLWACLNVGQAVDSTWCYENPLGVPDMDRGYFYRLRPWKDYDVWQFKNCMLEALSFMYASKRQTPADLSEALRGAQIAMMRNLTQGCRSSRGGLKYDTRNPKSDTRSEPNEANFFLDLVPCLYLTRLKRCYSKVLDSQRLLLALDYATCGFASGILPEIIHQVDGLNDSDFLSALSLGSLFYGACMGEMHCESGITESMCNVVYGFNPVQTTMSAVTINSQMISILSRYRVNIEQCNGKLFVERINCMMQAAFNLASPSVDGILMMDEAISPYLYKVVRFNNVGRLNAAGRYRAGVATLVFERHDFCFYGSNIRRPLAVDRQQLIEEQFAEQGSEISSYVHSLTICLYSRYTNLQTVYEPSSTTYFDGREWRSASPLGGMLSFHFDVLLSDKILEEKSQFPSKFDISFFGIEMLFSIAEDADLYVSQLDPRDARYKRSSISASSMMRRDRTTPLVQVLDGLVLHRPQYPMNWTSSIVPFIPYALYTHVRGLQVFDSLADNRKGRFYLPDVNVLARTDFGAVHQLALVRSMSEGGAPMMMREARALVEDLAYDPPANNAVEI